MADRVNDAEFYLGRHESIDLRLLLALDDWADLVNELDAVERLPHTGEPEEYPCIVATIALQDKWLHGFEYRMFIKSFYYVLKERIPEQDWINFSKRAEEESLKATRRQEQRIKVKVWDSDEW